MFKENSVLSISLILSILFVIIGVAFNDWLGQKASVFLNFTVTYFNWFYLLVGTIFVGFCLFLMFSKYGKTRLGKDTDKPAYSTLSWISMLFSAGMGVGLVFWAVAEPVSHYITPPTGEGATAEAATEAMKATFFHWGMHPWALFGTVALGLAYFHFRKGLPPSISSIFYPLLGNRIYETPGKIIDIVSVFITAVGVASTFGLSTLQINNGMNAQWGVPITFPIQMLIIGFATLLFIISSWSGLNRGLKYLSYFNIVLLAFVVSIILILGPTRQIFEILISTTGSYVGSILPTSLRMEPFNSEGSNWIGTWTVFYWAWWTTWSPFVGSFVARISKGRTIKEFVLGVLLVPSLISFIWFSVLGGSAIHLIHDLGNSQLAETINANVDGALFAFLSEFPLGNFLSILALLLIFIFFITSADSATFVLGMLSSNGKPNPSRNLKITWGLITAGSAVVFLLAGGLEAVRTIAIVIATPFTIITVFICWAVLKELRNEDKIRHSKIANKKYKVARYSDYNYKSRAK
ncbi:BCCT family transporter [Oceanobacillus sp. M60]|uniref:BCCT family transporter n=1 Tax=Oceanobacillus TaxID=182709 RepID=UPI001867DC86|nr:BCCT family transporter [Oceanobacillus oncorhynchi]UUI41542.1 BCCT family transporter [Oceanobacillus oncorhynchi]